MTLTKAKSFFVGDALKHSLKGIVDLAEGLTFGDQLVHLNRFITGWIKSFCSLGDRLNGSDGGKATFSAKNKNWIKFRECGEFFN